MSSSTAVAARRAERGAMAAGGTCSRRASLGASQPQKRGQQQLVQQRTCGASLCAGPGRPVSAAGDQVWGRFTSAGWARPRARAAPRGHARVGHRIACSIAVTRAPRPVWHDRNSRSRQLVRATAAACVRSHREGVATGTGAPRESSVPGVTGPVNACGCTSRRRRASVDGSGPCARILANSSPAADKCEDLLSSAREPPAASRAR